MLRRDRDCILCLSEDCNAVFPVIDNIPVLLHEKNSVFTIDDFKQKRDTFFETRPGRIKQNIKRLLPGLSKKIHDRQHLEMLVKILRQTSGPRRVLVLGGGMPGSGTELFTNQASFDVVETDVAIGPGTMLICDAHDIPFADESFDCVIARSVLEHVADPSVCVAEIYRVLRKGGVVYAETAFMTPVHGGRYDFTRFTHLGHRRLFRKFDEIESGMVCGPGSALANAYRYFLISFASSKTMRMLLSAFAYMTAFPLKYADYFLVNKPYALDSASEYYFIGQKTGEPVSDRELINLYRGGFQ